MSYTILTSPPVLDPPAIVVGPGPACVILGLTPAAGASLFQTEVQITYTEGDWGTPLVYFVSPDTLGAILPTLESRDVWVRARSNDKYLTAVSWSDVQHVLTLAASATFDYAVLIDRADSTEAEGTVT